MENIAKIRHEIEEGIQNADERLLRIIQSILNEDKKNIVAYDTSGKPLTEAEYVREIDNVVNEMESGADEGLPAEQVFKNISDAYHLEQNC
jgi:hypothetical protein